MESRRSFLDNPKVQTLGVILAALVGYLFLIRAAGQGIDTFDILKTILFLILRRWGDIPVNIQLLAKDAMLFLFGTLLWLAFFAQFVLPVRNLLERFRAFDRLVVYAAGTSGAALFVEDGSVRKRAGETERHGPGVVILDTASAAVLHNNVKFTQVSGPGLVFTRKGERLADTVDLHRKIGPFPALGPISEEDPFKAKDPSGKEESAAEYEARQERRKETSGLTRDGVEVVPNVMAIFRLDPGAGEAGPGFQYNEIAVRRWVTVEGKRILGGREEPRPHVPLEKLPAYLAVDVWREYLQKFTLSELFALPVPGEPAGETGLETILNKVNQRLRESEVEELDEFGNPSGTLAPSREFEILQACGIRVDAAVINRLRFEPLVEKKLLDDWVANWLTRSQAEYNQVERERGLNVQQGKREGLTWFAEAATQRLTPDMLAQPRPSDPEMKAYQMRVVLEKLVLGTLDGCRSDSQLYPRLMNELILLGEIVNYIREQRP